MMNCKPGDIALIIGANQYAGRLVHVLAAPPLGRFVLPNGVSHDAVTDPDRWIIKSLGSPFPHSSGDGMYGVGMDKYMMVMPLLAVDRIRHHFGIKKKL